MGAHVEQENPNWRTSPEQGVWKGQEKPQIHGGVFASISRVSG